MTKEEEVSLYERIRDAALGANDAGTGDYGRALLMSRGMVAWLEALARYAPERAHVVRRAAATRVDDCRGMGAEIARVLACMAFSVLR